MMDQESQVARPPPEANNHRSQSRASTSSAHSAGTQPNMEQRGEPASNRWIAANAATEMPSQLAADAMMLRAATNGQEYPMNSNAPMGHQAPMQQQQLQPHPQHHHHQMPRHPLPHDQFARHGSFTDGDSQMMDADANENEDSMMSLSTQARTSGARSSANNEIEMRQLFSLNRHRHLPDVAGELHGNERGPNSERTRQVFAMLWINQVCSRGKGSVPRGRVYANYASRCATERITVLNPASFGKLVRVLFPGLKTRRLGIRGESKYHYVNFNLVDDQPEPTEALPPQPSQPRSESASVPPSLPVPKKTQSPMPREALAPPPTAGDARAPPARGASDVRAYSLYNVVEVSTMDNIQSTSHKTPMELSFPAMDESFIQSDPLAMPAIEPFLPKNTDRDAAKSLSALYRSHCTSLIECIRFCREKTFFHLYTSFMGTLTMPVQKLFAKPELAVWIECCDLALYQRMMTIVSGLTLQVLPKPVMATLRSISERLVPHIRVSFQGLPQHVLEAKEAPATLFAGLLDRALRVNLTAHAAANMLSLPANRSQMYVDWITTIRPRKVAQVVPSRGMDDLVDVLVKEMRTLLDPVDVPWEVECLTIYGEAAMRDGRPLDGEAETGATGHTVLDKWVAFLSQLPQRFPYASHADIMLCVERVGSAAMRELTISQGKSFGSWWVTKVWIDEMIGFLVEQGGFMKMKKVLSRTNPDETRHELTERDIESHAEQPAPEETPRDANSRESSAGGTSQHRHMPPNGALEMTASQPGRAPFPPKREAIAPAQVDVDEDSGIGIQTPDEEFTMDKFTFTAEARGELAV